MDKDFDFRYVGKRTPYRIPDGSMDRIEKTVYRKIGTERRRKSFLLWGGLALAAALLAGLVYMPRWRADRQLDSAETACVAVETTYNEWIYALSDEQLEEMIILTDNDVFLN